MTAITGIHPYADKFPMLPDSGKRLCGYCSTPEMSLATVTPSTTHPGYYNVEVFIGGQHATTRRPVSGDFVAHSVNLMSAGAAYHWKVEDDSAPTESASGSSVYFISDEDGYIKIGFARSVQSRMADLQTASRQQLTLMATTQGSLRDEAALHRKFSTDRVRGEWFRPSPALTEYIKELPK